MKDKNTNLAAVMQFAGICSSEFGNKTIQELKEEVGRAKYYEINETTVSLQHKLKKIKDDDKSIIEDFDETLMDGLE
ncbi:hypothetical protein [Sulfuricurvum sp.]|jgi:predicted secreted acid phosphatase|uniref:hypothetical protein n=1 Tax=Sulfuricurvum sp. TaxID=2025608 RepID=UPI002628CF57|nr:hypothetical protein [Sulfuricurvum sp.]MDD2782349.1 hypothetical protein [Sulfuricurvum sp.]